jgi:hypothetical protein
LARCLLGGALWPGALPKRHRAKGPLPKGTGPKGHSQKAPGPKAHFQTDPGPRASPQRHRAHRAIPTPRPQDHRGGVCDTCNCYADICYIHRTVRQRARKHTRRRMGARMPRLACPLWPDACPSPRGPRIRAGGAQGAHRISRSWSWLGWAQATATAFSEEGRMYSAHMGVP